MGRLADKRALITGGGSGLGRAIAAAFHQEGAKVAVTDLNDDTAQQVAGAHDGMTAWRQDVTDEAAWEASLEAMHERFGGIDILVNNAGIGLPGRLEDTTLEDWRRVHAVDLDSVFLGCKHAVRRIHQSGGGAIVNISSIAGIVASSSMPAYHTAKAGVRHLSKAVALYCARAGLKVRCNSVHPAFINTPILDGVLPGKDRQQTIAALASSNPMRRIGEPDEVAWPVVFLASEEASYINGSELLIDGGLSAM